MPGNGVTSHGHANLQKSVAQERCCGNGHGRMLLIGWKIYRLIGHCLDVDLSKLQPYAVYVFAKTIAEQELWKFADEHPEIDVTTSK